MNSSKALGVNWIEHLPVMFSKKSPPSHESTCCKPKHLNFISLSDIDRKTEIGGGIGVTFWAA